nr:prealbumin-like fold domain-containing protein [Bifidobacterium pongonis]
MGAQGDTTLVKTDAALHNPKTLPGTTFTVCKVDISDNATNTAEQTTCDGTYSKTITTGNEGQATLSSRAGTDTSSALYNLSTSTLYAAVETQAPNGYQLDAAPYYFYLRDTNDAETDQLKTMKEYVSAHKLTVESNDEIHARDQKISTISWNKVKAASATIDDNDKATLTGGDSAYLAGSSWAICTDQCGTDAASYVYVADNGKAETTDSGNQWLADLDSRDGYITISGFKQNTVYQVTEVSAPDGYTANAGADYTFEITSDGNVTVGMLDSDGRNVPSTNADFPALAKAHGFAQLEDGSWIVTNAKKPLTSMPFTGRANWLGVILAAGLVLAMVGYRLTSSSGKERRPKRIHARE